MVVVNNNNGTQVAEENTLRAAETQPARQMAPPTPSPGRETLGPRREAVLSNFLQESLSAAAPEEALLGVANGILMGMLFELDDSRTKLSQEEGTLRECLQAQAWAAATVLPLCRQIERFTQLRNTLAMQRRKNSGPAAR